MMVDSQPTSKWILRTREAMISCEFKVIQWG
jgi:hypothetical protein